MMQLQGDKIRGYGRQLRTYAHGLGHGQLDDALKQALAANRKPNRTELNTVIDILAPIFQTTGGAATAAEVPLQVVGIAGWDSGGTWAASMVTLSKPQFAKTPYRCMDENMDYDSDMVTCQRLWVKNLMTHFKTETTVARFVGMDSAAPWRPFLTSVAHALLVDMAAVTVNMSNAVKIIVVLGSSATRGKFEEALRGGVGPAAAAVRPSADMIRNMMPSGFTSVHTDRLIANLSEGEAGMVLAAGKRVAQDHSHVLWKHHVTTTKGELKNGIAKQFLRDSEDREPEVALAALSAASPDMRSGVFHSTAAPYLNKYVATWYKLNEMNVEGFKWKGAPLGADVRTYQVNGVVYSVTLPPVQQQRDGGAASITRVVQQVAALYHKIRYHGTTMTHSEEFNHGLRSLMQGYGEGDRDFADIQNVADDIALVMPRLDVVRDMSLGRAYDVVAAERGLCDFSYTHAVLTTLSNIAEELLVTMAPLYEAAANKRAVTVMLRATRKRLGFGSTAIAGGNDTTRSEMKAFASGQRQQRKDAMAAEQLALARDAANDRKRRSLPNEDGRGLDDKKKLRREGSQVETAKVVCLKCGVRGHYKAKCVSDKFILKQTEGAAPRLLSYAQASWIGKQAAFDTTRTYDTIECSPAGGSK